MKMHKTLNATDREAWRAWLSENHGSEREVWLVFPNRRTGKVVMSYEDAVGEALCYGWIDSIVQRLDDKSYARKFTPRTDNLRWSELNKRRVAKLIRENRMTDIGLAKVGYSNPEQRRPKPKRKVWSVPRFMKTALQAQPKAWENFSALAPSHQRNYVGWVMDAKRDETRQRRLAEAIHLLTENRKLGLK
jgi:uncharacterized protein YdeI (YjbR/CyaY-like superfamily)